MIKNRKASLWSQNMSYDFSFDKKTVTFLLGGFAFVGIMLFIAGLLVGTNWKAEPPAIAAATVVQPAIAATPAPAPAPQEPVARPDTVKPEADTPIEADTPDASPTPAKKAHAVPSMEIMKELAPPPVDETDSEVKVIERANPSAAAADDSNKADQLTYSVQVGIFQDKNEANQLVRQLRNKGFAPIVLSASDNGTQWYSVRIGVYTNQTEAAEAASNLARQEKIKTIVRPLGSL